MYKKLIGGIIVVICGLLSFTGCNEETRVSLSDGSETTVNDTAKDTVTQNNISEEIVVYVNGAVKTPGVYTLKHGDRVYQAVELAGGMTKNAKKNAINLAETLADAENIHIMTKKEYRKSHKEKKDSTTEQENNADTGFVNINVDNQEKLMTLPGIGESKAKAIIRYREENGKFSSIEDIKNVSGIGDATYANLKDMIVVE